MGLVKYTMTFLKIFLALICILLLTLVTQIGGIVLVFSFLTFGYVEKRVKGSWKRLVVKTLIFATLYVIFVFLLVPQIAKPFGRVPLPVFENRHLKPGNFPTCLLNRHYVRSELREIAYQVAENMNTKYPGATVNYLDANFPFINKFPLLPHRSHNDGKKLDLSFQYNDSRNGEMTNDIPSFIGYGICEEPKEGEFDTPGDCGKKGYWQYSLLKEIVPQGKKSKFIFDTGRTRDLIIGFASVAGIGKIFIEPHLKTRLGLTNAKIGFHGCQAVRHDDHIHVQLK